MGAYFVLAAAIAVMALLVLLRRASRSTAQVKEERLTGREELSAQGLWDRYYSKTSVPVDVVADALGEIHRCLGIAAGKVRPEDRFDKELADIGAPLDGSLYELFSELKLRCEPTGSWPRGKIATVDDYVRVLAAVECREQGNSDTNDAPHTSP